MRIISLLGLGLPVLAVSGAVAYGSIREISRSLAPAPVAQSSAATLFPPVAQRNSVPTQAAQAFVAAGQSVWDIPQPATNEAPRFADDILSTASIVALSSSEQDGAARDASPIYGTPVVEEASAGSFGPVRQPRVVVTSKPRAERPRPAVENRAKRSFKMPWQTGIFQ